MKVVGIITVVLFAFLFGVMMWCAFAVVTHADGKHADKMWVPAGGSAYRPYFDPEMFAAGKTFDEPVYISDDGWVANFCPHAGTSLVTDSRGRLHTVWFTVGRQDEDAGIYYAFSDDGGKTFAPRQLIARSPKHTVVHTQVILDSEDRVWAAWENIIESKPQIFLAHRARDDTHWSSAYQVSDGSTVAMLPTLAARDGKVYVAWQDMKGEQSQIKIRTATLESG